MYKSLIPVAVALIVLSAGSLASNRAEAGASASAPTRYSAASSVSGWTSWLRIRRANGSSEFTSSNRSRRR